MHDDIGTLRWFGASWGAPVNDPRAEIPTPTGEKCIYCHLRIGPHDNGISIPYMDDGFATTRAAYHRECFLASIGFS